MFYFDLIVEIKVASIIEIIRIIVIIKNVFLISLTIIRIKIVLNILNW